MGAISPGTPVKFTKEGERWVAKTCSMVDPDARGVVVSSQRHGCCQSAAWIHQVEFDVGEETAVSLAVLDNLVEVVEQ